MFRERRRRLSFVGLMAVGLVLALAAPFVAQGADQFASPAFERQWRTVEGAIPNFWGPLETAQRPARAIRRGGAQRPAGRPARPVFR